MHDLAVRLIEESRREGPDAEANGDAGVGAIELLFQRLRPVIGARGFHALFVRAVGAVGDRRPAVATAVACQTVDQGLHELKRALGGTGRGVAEPDDVVVDVLESLLRTLERMIGADLTARLAAGNVATGHRR